MRDLSVDSLPRVRPRGHIHYRYRACEQLAAPRDANAKQLRITLIATVQRELSHPRNRLRKVTHGGIETLIARRNRLI